MSEKLFHQDFALSVGQVAPFGATVNEIGCNFSIYCPDAQAVYLCLFDDADNEIAQLQLEQRIQSKWFGFVRGVSTGQKYAYRVASKPHRKVNKDMDVGRLLIDPYATQLSHTLNWDRHAYEGEIATVLGQSVKNNASFIPKSIVTARQNNIAHPVAIQSTVGLDAATGANDRIIYEAHIKGLTQLHPDVPEEHKGTFLGACHPSVLKHLTELGVTAVQFMPIFAFMPEPYISEKGLTNYWGYNPINFFSPDPRYCVSDALLEFKYMVAQYHKAGLEVILDVVFNHTAESGEPGSILSFKGLCHKQAYLLIENDELSTPTYVNYSGCGNTINSASTYMRTLIIDALRYWVTEAGVDGFRFDLAASLGREPLDFHADAAIFKILRQDPVLKELVMIAEPWDIGPGGYQLGQFPDYWLEVNDKFRDNVRGFWRSDAGLKAGFATRFMGSRDVFPKGVRPMQTSINNVTYHDGFTLHDMVSYSQKHNLANLEDNHDGHNHNLSSNFGVEGPSSDPTICALREKQKRNLFATLILSQGTPHVLGGDELSRTQQGNNNAYCQDNAISWFDWDLSDQSGTQASDQSSDQSYNQVGKHKQQFLSFAKYVIALRKNNPLLSRMMFADDQFDNEVNIASVDWYRIDGSSKRDTDWTNDNHHEFAMHVVGLPNQSTNELAQEWLYVVNSAKQNVEFHLPLLLDSESWQCVLNTALVSEQEYAAQVVSSIVRMESRSFSLFKKKN